MSFFFHSKWLKNISYTRYNIQVKNDNSIQQLFCENNLLTQLAIVSSQLIALMDTPISVKAFLFVFFI